MSKDLTAYIAGHVVIPRPDCAIWTGGSYRGYGKASVNGVTKRVHRIAWELEHGPIPDGLTVDHLCGIRACVNVAHMELVTAEENGRRGNADRRNACPRGHALTADNVYICRNGKKRECLTCRRARQSAVRAARRASRLADTG